MRRLDFIEATDRLTGCPTHADVAEATGVSLQSVRQARMKPSSAGYRRPPEGWENAVAKLARLQADQLWRLAEELEAGVD